MTTETKSRMIGAAHAGRRNTMLHALDNLNEMADGVFANAFSTQLDRVQGWTARIAAVGQVKAGKSSMLNALIGDIGFLPSDVNPWTSVVTNMRINVPGDPGCGARFEFFDEASWDRIIHGDPRVRKAAQKFLPGFDPEVLRQQTEEMRAFAKRRLGDSFQKLLGSSHDYDLLSGDLLQSYVCAGPGIADASDVGNVGRYSAITKVANLFLRSDEYAVPTVITDTPGVNDPFLVRDEFTCQSLDQSDIFLVMLSAHQALTQVDIALIRMLSLQDNKDVIIFINRVDELENSVELSVRVAEDVRKRLARAIPGRDFPILFGSAYWAELAMRDDVTEAVLRKTVADDNIAAFLLRHRGGIPDSPQECLLAASGLLELKAALSRSINDGVGNTFLESVAGEAQAHLSAMRSVMARRRHELQDRIELYGTGRTGEFREALTGEMRNLAEAHTALGTLIETVNDALDGAINEDWVALQRKMDTGIDDFISNQRTVIESIWAAESAPKEAEVDLIPLRTVLEDTFHSSYATSRAALDAMLGDALEQAEKIAMDAIGAEIGMAMDGLPHEHAAASFSTARKTLSFDLSSRRSWKFWKAKQVDLDKTVAGLKRVVAAEVFPATNRMVVAFTSCITDRALAGKSRLELLASIVEESLNDRLQRLREDYKMVEKDSGGEARGKLLNRLQNDIEIIESRLQRAGSVEGAFATDEARAA